MLVRDGQVANRPIYVTTGPVTGWDLAAFWNLTVTGEVDPSLVTAWVGNCVAHVIAHPFAWTVNNASPWTAIGQAQWDALQ